MDFWNEQKKDFEFKYNDTCITDDFDYKKYYDSINSQSMRVKNFSEKSIMNSFRKVKQLADYDKPAKNHSELVEKMEKSYFKKSLKTKKFFLLNVSQKINKITQEPIIDFSESPFVPFNNDLEFKIKNDELVADWNREFLKGQFLFQQDKEYAYKKYSKVKYLEYINKDMDGRFLTFTLPSEYHMYRRKKNISETSHTKDLNNWEKNPKYSGINFEDNIWKSMDLITKISSRFSNLVRMNLQITIRKEAMELTNRDINNLITKFNKDDLKMIRKDMYQRHLDALSYKSDYIKIIEPHNNLTPHLHILQFFREEHKEVVINRFKEVINEFNLYRKSQKVIDVDKSKGNISSYISKYLLKNLDMDLDDEEVYEQSNFYNFYKRYFGSKYKLFVTSDFKFANQKKIDYLYNYLKKNNAGFLERLKYFNREFEYENGKPLYFYLEIMIKHNYVDIKEEMIKKTKIDLEMVENVFKNFFEKEIKWTTFEMSNYIAKSKTIQYLDDNLKKFIVSYEEKSLISMNTDRYLLKSDLPIYQKDLYTESKMNINQFRQYFTSIDFDSLEKHPLYLKYAS